jgi:hypothetical protein
VKCGGADVYGWLLVFFPVVFNRVFIRFCALLEWRGFGSPAKPCVVYIRSLRSKNVFCLVSYFFLDKKVPKNQGFVRFAR